MKPWIRGLLLSCVLALSGCATLPDVSRTGELFHDERFTRPAVPIDAETVFAITPEMRHYVRTKVFEVERHKGPQQALFDALYNDGDLKLEYDATVTRNAQETFRTRSGNCLSLAIMTAALAREIGLSVHYRSVYVDEMWSRAGDLYFMSGHINLTLDKKIPGFQTGWDSSQSYTVDFLPPDQIRGQRSKTVSEATVVAMYMNNRAAESLVGGELDQAYWFAREAIRQDPRFTSAYNTLGVVYQRHGDLQLAEQAYAAGMILDPKNTVVLFNQSRLLKLLGRDAEAARLAGRLAELEAHDPYRDFHLGRAAFERGDYAAARDLFAREAAHDPYNAEFHFWLANAYLRLGDLGLANEEMQKALEYTTTTRDRVAYSAKLERLKAAAARHN